MESGNAVALFRLCVERLHSSPISEPPMSSSAQKTRSRAHRPDSSGTRLSSAGKKIDDDEHRQLLASLIIDSLNTVRMALRRRKFAHLRENVYSSSEAWLSREKPPDQRNALRSYFQHTPKRGQNQQSSAENVLSLSSAGAHNTVHTGNRRGQPTQN